MVSRWNINYDETKVADFTLPAILKFCDGQNVTTSSQWTKRREEILQLFQEHIYGEFLPSKPVHISEIESTCNIFGGLGNRRQFRITIETDEEPIKINLLLYLPTSKKKLPIFLGLNFHGNQTICDDPDILMNENWVFKSNKILFANNRADEASRGGNEHRWQVRKVLKNGFGIATAYYGDICPDNANDFNSCRKRFHNTSGYAEKSLGAIGLWAWGLVRIMDSLENIQEIDLDNVIVMGHSRLGKTALWAAAQDKRFSAVISNNSGCCGASLSRRNFGETFEALADQFDYWFCPKFMEYVNNEEALPVDQHMLLSLCAPRPLLVCSASKDLWADPKGEFLSTSYASDAYRLFGYDGLKESLQPPIKKIIGENICYHLRSGPHDVTADDWDAFLSFASENCL